MPRTWLGRLLAGVWVAVREAAAAARPPQREPTKLPLLPCQTPLRTPLPLVWHRMVAESRDTAAVQLLLLQALSGRRTIRFVGRVPFFLFVVARLRWQAVQSPILPVFPSGEFLSSLTCSQSWNCNAISHFLNGQFAGT